MAIEDILADVVSSSTKTGSETLTQGGIFVEDPLPSLLTLVAFDSALYCLTLTVIFERTTQQQSNTPATFIEYVPHSFSFHFLSRKG